MSSAPTSAQPTGPTGPTTARKRRRPGRYTVIATLAVLAVLGGLLGPWAYASFANSSAKDRIAADPPPTLFDDATVAPMAGKIAGQSPTASRLMSTWWSGHGTGRHDAAFTAWLEKTLPGPPSPAARTAEVDAVAKLAPTRTAAGVAASTWLETYGKKDVWKLYAHDQTEMLPSGVGNDRKSAVKDMLSMSKTVADALGARYRQSAPYVLHPSLRPDHTVTPGQVCPCSYPSRHATGSAAARTFLSYLEPHRASEFRWMESEVAWSRVYMAGHVPSDITGGALLGDLIGDYFLVTRAHVPSAAADASLTAVGSQGEALPAPGHAG
ncbi:MAG: phosphatase PAP2 family protein [Nocardioidaceae bacterium]